MKKYCPNRVHHQILFRTYDWLFRKFPQLSSVLFKELSRIVCRWSLRLLCPPSQTMVFLVSQSGHRNPWCWSCCTCSTNRFFSNVDFYLLQDQIQYISCLWQKFLQLVHCICPIELGSHQILGPFHHMLQTLFCPSHRCMHQTLLQQKVAALVFQLFQEKVLIFIHLL